ncbi:MAG: hypothetical protein KA354_09945 [Phycisphaerae bacterium]|nr:hypothetical protein [Phycisphaerae bacterium]
MHTRHHPFRPRLRCRLALMVSLAVITTVPVVAQYGGIRGGVQRNLDRGRGTASPSARPGDTTRKGSETTLTSEEQRKIVAEQDPDKLVAMAQELLTANKESGARLCLDRAVKAKPALLTLEKAPGAQASKEWASFWYVYKAKQQEKQLDAKDAAGRVKIAEWLHKVGEDGAARDLLKSALKISKDDPEALKRLEEWNLSTESGFHIDLAFGLSQSLLPESISDEGQELEPRRDQRFMLVPVAYDPGDAKLQIMPSALKAKSDSDKPCRVVGIMLLLASGSIPAMASGSSSRVSGLQLQQPNDPILEQIEAQRAKDGSMDLTLYNRVHPRPKREPGAPAGRTPREPTPRPAPGEGKQTVPGSGYAVFLIEVPESAQSVQVICRNDPPATLGFEFLEQLSKVNGELQPSERTKLIDALIVHASSQTPCLASAAIAGLASIREKAAAAPDSGLARSGGDRRSPTTQKLEKAMLTGLESASPQVRRETFSAFVYSPAPLALATLSTLWGEKKTAPAMYLLDQVESILQAVPATEDRTPVAPVATASDDRTQRLMAMVAELPPSPAPQNVFSILAACLGSGIPAIYQRSLDLIVAYPSQQSLVTVADMPRTASDVRAALIERLTKVTENATKTAAMRILLSMPDESTTVKLLEACEGTKTALTGADDPILRAFKRGQPPQVQIKLVELLGRSDLSRVAGETAFADVLKMLASDATKDAGLQAALLKLARGQFQVTYEAPIHRGQGLPAAGGGVPGKSSAPELLLATLATVPKGDPKAAREAAGLLIEAGRLGVLEEQLKQATSVDQRVQVVQNVGVSKELAKREALPVFLARRLADPEEKVSVMALNALAEIYKNADANQRWRLDLAVKSGVDAKEILRLVQSKDTKVARAAMSLIRQLGKMSAAESDQIQSSEPGTRDQKYAAFNDQRGAKPSGTYQCVVYLDVKSAATANPQDGNAGGMEADLAEGVVPLTEGTSLPCPDLRLTLQPEGAQGFRVIFDGRDLTLVGGEGDAGGPSRSAAPSSTGPVTLRIDAAPILLEALKKAQDQKSSFAAQVNQVVLNDRVPCELRHEQLGTWGGELQLQGAGAQRGMDLETPLQITGGKIYLELVEAGK